MCLCSFFAAKDYEMEIIWQASRNPSPFREKIFGIGSSLQGEVSGLERVCVCGWVVGWLGGLIYSCKEIFHIIFFFCVCVCQPEF